MVKAPYNSRTKHVPNIYQTCVSANVEISAPMLHKLTSLPLSLANLKAFPVLRSNPAV